MSRNVLLVDDSSTIRNILKVYLMGKDVDFLDAEDGERALTLARLMPVELIIADIDMPKLDGLGLTRALRSSADERLRRLPIVLLTGAQRSGVRDEAAQAGASAFLQKPVSREELARTIDQLLGERRA